MKNDSIENKIKKKYMMKYCRVFAVFGVCVLLCFLFLFVMICNNFGTYAVPVAVTLLVVSINCFLISAELLINSKK